MAVKYNIKFRAMFVLIAHPKAEENGLKNRCIFALLDVSSSYEQRNS